MFDWVRLFSRRRFLTIGGMPTTAFQMWWVIATGALHGVDAAHVKAIAYWGK